MENRQYKYYDIIMATFAVVLVLSNIASAKILSLGWFSFDGGTIIFPLSYIFGDILTEVYGYSRARRVIWTGFALNLLMVAVFYSVGRLPPAADWPFQESYMNILGVVPRIVAGSLVAYLIGEFLNSYVLAKLKVRTQGKYFWLRALGSTVVAEFFDTSIFLTIAFAGVLPWNLLWVVWVSNYVFKILTEVILLPLTYRATKYLKTKEAEDYYDTNTNFNPFAVTKKEA